MDKNKSLTEIFEQYLSPKVPKKITNILYNLFKGIDTAFGYIESYLKVSKREQNLLTAQEVSSLRHLASKNGFEPQLKIPSMGKIVVIPNGVLFAKHGTSLFLPAYAKLTEQNTGLEYFVDNNNNTKINNEPTLISIKQGVIESQVFNVLSEEKLQRFYIKSSDVADKSITVFDVATKEEYQLVESFYDNVNVNNNKQFIIKFSTKPTEPIVLYIKGTNVNDSLNISYILTQGTNGNLIGESNFNFETLLNYKGDVITYSDDELTITNYDGFTLGSNGSDINTLKSAIGFNHGINLLFDAVSYRNFIAKFSTILIQNIFVDDAEKVIKHLYLGNKNIIIGETEQAKEMYNNVINNNGFQFSKIELENLEEIISDNEFALSSSIIHPLKVQKFALQIKFKSYIDLNKYVNKLDLLLYNEFSKFLYLENHKLDLDNLFNNFSKDNNIILDYITFNDLNNDNITFIDSTNILPILQGNFNIFDKDEVPFRINKNITYITE